MTYVILRVLLFQYAIRDDKYDLESLELICERIKMTREIAGLVTDIIICVLCLKFLMIPENALVSRQTSEDGNHMVINYKSNEPV